VTAALEIDDYARALSVYRHPHLAQALYDKGERVMADSLITLHGREHARRRAAEYGVFNRRFFRTYEAQVFPRTLRPVLEPYLSAGRADLVELGYRVTMNLTADFAGVDRMQDDAEETEALLALVKTFSAGATMVHSTLDHDAINAAVEQAMAVFETRFLRPSLERRQRLFEANETLPNDVLSMLVRHQHKLGLSFEVLRREMAFYLQAGAHSTANATTHAFHETVTWRAQDPSRRGQALQDADFVQRCVHEALRLHPASPVAWRKATQATDVDGHHLEPGDRVVINLQTVNRDPRVFGENAARFDPERKLPPNVWPFGLSFGYGIHACVGRDLDGGTVPKPKQPRQFGIVALLLKTLLDHQASGDPTDPPQADAGTSRSNWGRYVVRLRRERVV